MSEFVDFSAVDLIELGYGSEDCIPGIVWLGGDRDGDDMFPQVYDEAAFSAWYNTTHAN